MPIPSYHNQLSFLDLFYDPDAEKEKGNTSGAGLGNDNNNLGVCGTSGGGKSFLMQTLIRHILDSGGRATGGKTWDYYVSRITGAKPNGSALFGTLMADSYNYYYGGGATASQVMRSAVVMNGLKQGISSYSAQNGDAAGLVNLASQSSYAKMRLSQATSASIATTYLPLMNTVLLAMVIGLFPVIILLATVHSLTLQVLKGYIYTLIYLQAWGPMFAILNYAVSSYLTNKTGSLSFSLSNLSVIQQTHADIGSIAGDGAGQRAGQCGVAGRQLPGNGNEQHGDLRGIPRRGRFVGV